MDSSPVVTWNSGFLLSLSRAVGPLLKLKLGIQGYSQVAVGDSGFLSSYSLGLRVTLKPWRVSQGSSQFGTGVQGSSRVSRGFLSSRIGTSHLLQGCAGWVLSCSNVRRHNSLVLVWVFTLDMVGVNSVAAVGSILSSCSVQAPLLLWCEVHLY